MLGHRELRLLLARREEVAAAAVEVERLVEVERGRDQCEVRERLREVAQVFTALADLLAVEAEMIGITGYEEDTDSTTSCANESGEHVRHCQARLPFSACWAAARTPLVSPATDPSICSNMSLAFSRYFFLNMPSRAAASTAQKVQMEKVPSSPTRPSCVCSTL